MEIQTDLAYPALQMPMAEMRLPSASNLAERAGGPWEAMELHSLTRRLANLAKA